MAETPLRNLDVPRVVDDWYVLARSAELGRRPIARELHGRPIALFRDGAGRAAALVDRCPHRNVPLSAGRVEQGELECPYHGWRFDPDGRCTTVPGLAGEADHRSRRCGAHAVRERDGFVWVWATEGVTPTRDPFDLPLVRDPRYATVYQTIDVAGTVHAVAENALDVPHTAYLHRGLFRGTGKTNEIEVRVRRFHDHVEAEYVGEPRPEGMLGRVLAPRGGVVEHFDRFFLPSIAQVEYRLGESHVVATTALTPLDDRRTRMHGVASFRLPFLSPRLGQPIGQLLRPLALLVLRQDARILAKQDAILARFGETRFASTELDVLGPSILKLLRQAERGRSTSSIETDATVDERSIRMRV
ncbi:MAG: aromatic ring-hydroxylating dioxygenase subunit alpha [Sandaracinus sp.]|nr:aromatic ring-hydroxylating dioxygenase subunit alpha [Sandaracinus sp.]